MEHDMTPEQLREAAAVMMAAADGKAIQAKIWDSVGEWSDISPENLMQMIYGRRKIRIKPEPQKVRIAMMKSRKDDYLLSVMEVDFPRFSEWKRVSDIVEIEVKDE
jgi:hypothetical protein